MRNFVPIIFVLTLLTCLASSSPSKNAVVNVEVRRISSRSASDGPSYQVKLSGIGEGYNLNLRSPASSVFSEDFSYTVADTDSSGNLHLREETPSRDVLQAIEDQIYIDEASDAAVSIRHIDGNFQVRGIVDGMRINPNGETHEMSTLPKKTVSSHDDFVDLKRNLTYSMGVRAVVNAKPETWVVFDYANSQQFGQNRTRILDYLGVFYHAINNRYATIAEPSIIFRMSGVTVVGSLSAQPYMENNKTPDGTGYDINKVLDAFSKWVYANRASGPKNDMAALISGSDFKSQDSSGTYSSGVAGLAYVGGTCLTTTDRSYATSVTEDRGGYYDGVFSVAHEFAHNLGSPHDGDGGSANCSWEDGYLMSYKGWGTTNKFYFSPCSINLMKNFISSNEGACTRTLNSNTTVPISSANVGDRYNMTALCVKYTSQPKAVPEPTKTASELCKNLSCRYPTPGQPEGYYSIVTLNHPPGDNSPCGTSGGRCTNGDCVVPSSG